MPAAVTEDPSAVRDRLRADAAAAAPHLAAATARFELAHMAHRVPLKYGGALAAGTPILYDPTNIRLEAHASQKEGRPMLMAAVFSPLRPEAVLGIWYHDLTPVTGTPAVPTADAIAAALRAEDDRLAARDHDGLPERYTVQATPDREQFTIIDTTSGAQITVQGWEFSTAKRVLIALTPRT